MGRSNLAAAETALQLLCSMRGSANELEYQILLSIDLKFIELENAQKLLLQIEEVKKMLNGLITKLNKG